MRLLLLVVFVSVSSAQQAAFVKKFENVLSMYFEDNTNMACDLVVTDIVNGLNMSAITTHLVKDGLSLVPSKKYRAAVTAFANFNNCLDKINSSLEEMVVAIDFGFNKHLTKLNSECAAKVKSMTANKKTVDEMKIQVYKILTNGLTKALVQQTINTIMSKCTQKQFECATPSLKTVLVSSNYDLVWKKTG